MEYLVFLTKSILHSETGGQKRVDAIDRLNGKYSPLTYDLHDLYHPDEDV